MSSIDRYHRLTLLLLGGQRFLCDLRKMKVSNALRYLTSRVAAPQQTQGVGPGATLSGFLRVVQEQALSHYFGAGYVRSLVAKGDCSKEIVRLTILA
jgi:hypothetical protein